MSDPIELLEIKLNDKRTAYLPRLTTEVKFYWFNMLKMTCRRFGLMGYIYGSVPFTQLDDNRFQVWLMIAVSAWDIRILIADFFVQDPAILLRQIGDALSIPIEF